MNMLFFCSFALSNDIIMFQLDIRVNVLWI